MAFLFNRAKTPAEFENLSIADYRARFKRANGDHLLVDVRTSGEYQRGHLPGAILIPLDQLAARVKELDQAKPVVVVCASGNRSRTGSQIMARAGFKTVYNLLGGTMQWMMSGNPIEK